MRHPYSGWDPGIPAEMSLPSEGSTHIMMQWGSYCDREPILIRKCCYSEGFMKFVPIIFPDEISGWEQFFGWDFRMKIRMRWYRDSWWYRDSNLAEVSDDFLGGQRTESGELAICSMAKYREQLAIFMKNADMNDNGKRKNERSNLKQKYMANLQAVLALDHFLQKSTCYSLTSFVPLIWRACILMHTCRIMIILLIQSLKNVKRIAPCSLTPYLIPLIL